MKNMNFTLIVIMIIGLSGLVHAEMDKCGGMKESNSKKSEMMQNNKGP